MNKKTRRTTRIFVSNQPVLRMFTILLLSISSSIYAETSQPKTDTAPTDTPQTTNKADSAPTTTPQTTTKEDSAPTATPQVTTKEDSTPAATPPATTKADSTPATTTPATTKATDSDSPTSVNSTPSAQNDLTENSVKQTAEPGKKNLKTLQKFEVTGSYIKRVDIEGPTPVVVIDRNLIDQSGATSLSQFLRTLPFNNGGFFNENQTQATTTSPGSSGINLRGMGQGATLILLNGHRIPSYSFAHNTTDTFVDLNSIPLGAVERIEVEKDGASATYGSDALAGVVNIILKKDIDDSEVTLEHGQSSRHDAFENHLNFVTGVSKGNNNITFIFDRFSRQPFLLGDRDFSKSASQPGAFSPNGAGVDYTTIDNNPANGVSFSQPPDPNCFGLSFCSGFFDPNPYITAVPKTQRTTGLVTVNKDINANLAFNMELLTGKVITDYQSAPSSLYGFEDNVVFPGSHVNNPYPGEDLYLYWRMTDVGPRHDVVETNNQHVLAGLKGSHNSVDWDFSLNYNRSDSQLLGTNYVNRLALIDAFNNNELNPFGTSDPSQIDSIRATISRKGLSELYSAQGKVTTEIGELNGGPIALAAGFERRYENMTDTPDNLTEQGQVLGQGGTRSSGNRYLTSVYGEAHLPVMDNLEFQVSDRIEQYSDFGRTTNPKLAVRYQPTSRLMLRASYGSGFKAPTLPELYQANTSVLQTLADTTRCTSVGLDCTPAQYQTSFGGNKNLDPETSKSFYLGTVFQVVKNMTVGLDYWNYREKNLIDSNTQYILDNESSFPARVHRDASASTGAGDPGPITSIDDTYINLAKQNTHGVDLDVKNQWQTTKTGTYGIHALLTRVLGFERQPYAGQPYQDLSGTYHFPKVRGNITFSWSKLAYGASLTANYIGEYKDLFYGKDLYGDGTVSGTRDLHMIDSYTSYDVQFVYSGLKNSKFRIGINNLTDKAPPLSNANNISYDFAMFDPTGRFYYASYSQKF